MFLYCTVYETGEFDFHNLAFTIIKAYFCEAKTWKCQIQSPTKQNGNSFRKIFISL